MYTKWTDHLKDPEEKSNFENQIISSKPVLKRLSFVLQETENGLDRSEMDIKNFDTPNWEYKQAYKNGQRSILHMLKTLIDLDKQKAEYK